MLNRKAPTVRGDDPRHRGIVSPRRAQTTNCTINDGHFITDNRRETRVHYDHSQTVNDSSNSTVFNAPVQGYVHTAKNGGAVSGYVQITNILSHKVGGSGEANPRDGPNENITTVSDATQMRGGGKESNREVGYSTTVAVGDAGSSAPTAPDHDLEQELHSLSPTMQDFVRALQEQRRENANTESVKRRNRTM